MKKLFVFLLLSFSVSLMARQIKSNGTGGGNFNLTGTWQGGTIPNMTGDTVEILGTDAVTVGSPNWPGWGGCTIDASGTLTINSDINLGNYVINNGTINGSGLIGIVNPSFGGSITISGSGTWSSFTGNIDFIANTITITSTMDIASSYILLAGVTNGHSVTVDNQGTFTAHYISHQGSVACTWTNDVNSNLTISGGSFSGDTFNASATGNTVTCGDANFTIPMPSSSTYYNLVLIGVGYQTTTLPGNLYVHNFTSASGVSEFNNYNMNLTGNWTNNSGDIPDKGTITFDGTGVQTIGGTSLTGFQSNLVIGASADVVLANNEEALANLTVNSNATLDCEAYQITGNTTGTFSMASGASLILGSTTSATAIAFPYKFTTANITLNSNSTVIYQANAAQSISDTASFGNLTLSTGSSASTKTTESTALNVAGNLTIGNNATLSGLSSGSLSIGGNLTNNGTYSVGTGTITMNGSGTQTIGGSTTITFHNLSISGTGTVSLTYNLTVTSNLNITSGTLDVTTSNYNLTVDANFTKTGGTLIPRSGTVTMNGSSGQILGGSSALTMNKLVIGTSGTTTLGGNITTNSTITINSGATLDASTSNYSITTAGNWTDNGAFTYRGGTVTFNATGNQCVSNHTSTETFQNMSVFPLTILGTSSTIIDILGRITIQPGGQMVCVCH